jgi:hypothetical protein
MMHSTNHCRNPTPLTDLLNDCHLTDPADPYLHYTTAACREFRTSVNAPIITWTKLRSTTTSVVTSTGNVVNHVLSVYVSRCLH